MARRLAVATPPSEVKDMQRKRDTLKQITASWAGRTLATGKMAAAVGSAAAAHALGAAREHEGLGQTLTEHLDGMKGLAMKVGQMASYLDGSMPEEAQLALRKLQRGGQPLAFEAIRAAIEAALGAPVTELFDHIDEEPLAAASIGQVHRATLRGAPVVVKVQYPGVASTFEVDLGNFGRVGRLATLGTALSVPQLVQELRERLDEECDYQREADAQVLFAELYADDPLTQIPAVHRDRSAKTVLTSSFAEGRGFYAFAEAASQGARDAAGERVFRFAFRNIFHHGLIHGDPHPGNLLFPDEGVVFLDHGCVRFFDRSFVENWKALAWCTLERRRHDLRDVTVAAGFAPNPDTYDWDAHWEVMTYLYEPFLTKRFRYTHDYVKRSYALMSMTSPNFRKTAMPAPWLLTNRLQWGLNSLLALLGAEGDFATVYREILSMPLVPAALTAR